MFGLKLRSKSKFVDGVFQKTLLPIDGSISSGLMTSSSSLNVIRLFLFFLTKFSGSFAIPSIEILLFWAVLNSVRLSSSFSVSGRPSKPPSASEPAFSNSSMIGLCIDLGLSLRMYFRVDSPNLKTESTGSWVGLLASSLTAPMNVPWAERC